MPKETFLNLPEEKRALICEAALMEFAQNSYESASINRIVAKAGIAKGSFYQYFEDKQDLFRYLIEVISVEKAAYLAPVLANPDDKDLFALLKDLYIAGIRFAQENPQYSEIGNKLLLLRNEPIYEEIYSDSMPEANDFFRNLLETALAKGDVRPNIDIQLFSYVVARMNALVVEYFATTTDHLFDDELLDSIDEFILFLRYGIGAGGAEDENQHHEQTDRSIQGERI
ncbi:MAG: TetR/AcrR family transcriptional regulator [Candidatus Promineifilaceae bacterium]